MVLDKYLPQVIEVSLLILSLSNFFFVCVLLFLRLSRHADYKTIFSIMALQKEGPGPRRIGGHFLVF